VPIIKSAKKRVRVSAKATAKNLRVKRQLRSALKSLRSSSKAADIETAKRQAQSAIDKAMKKGVMHKRKAAKSQKQLSAQAKARGMKPTKAQKAPVKKAVPKKPTAKKASPKTPAKKAKS